MRLPTPRVDFMSDLASPQLGFTKVQSSFGHSLQSVMELIHLALARGAHRGSEGGTHKSVDRKPERI